MAISDFLAESGAFVLWTPPTFHHRVDNYVRTATLLPPKERESYNRINTQFRPLTNLALLPGEIKESVRYLPAGNRRPFEKYTRSWYKSWQRFLSRVRAHWGPITDRAWNTAREAALIRYQRDPKRDEVPFSVYVEDLATKFQKAVDRGPNFMDLEFTYVMILPLALGEVRCKLARTFDSVVHRWLLNSYQSASERFRKTQTALEGLSKKAATVSACVFASRRYTRQPNIEHLCCLRTWLDFFNMDDALKIMDSVIERVEKYKERYHGVSADRYKSAQSDAVKMFMDVAQYFGRMSESFERVLDTDALKSRSKRWRTA